MFDAPFTSSFVVPVKEFDKIEKFDPRSDFTRRGELENIPNELKDTKGTVSALQAEVAEKKVLEEKLAKIKSIRNTAATLSKTSFGNVEQPSFEKWIAELDQALNSKSSEKVLE